MTTKISFLLKQTSEQRKQLETMAHECGASMTGYVQDLLDKAWGLRELAKSYATAEATVTKAPPVERIHNVVDYDRTMGIPPVTDYTPCAYDGNCAGCGKAPATGQEK